MVHDWLSRKAWGGCPQTLSIRRVSCTKGKIKESKLTRHIHQVVPMWPIDSERCPHQYQLQEWSTLMLFRCGATWSMTWMLTGLYCTSLREWIRCVQIHTFAIASQSEMGFQMIPCKRILSLMSQNGTEIWLVCGDSYRPIEKSLIFSWRPTSGHFYHGPRFQSSYRLESRGLILVSTVKIDDRPWKAASNDTLLEILMRVDLIMALQLFFTL